MAKAPCAAGPSGRRSPPGADSGPVTATTTLAPRTPRDDPTIAGTRLQGHPPRTSPHGRMTVDHGLGPRKADG
jgi:hypothetical protein